jgi:signal transduction histidine kinase
MKMKIKLVIIFTVISISLCFEASSQNVPDTLKIKTMADDTAKVNLLNRIADELRDFDTEKGLFYANKGLLLAKKLNYKLGIGEAHKALGINYYRMGIYDASLDNILKAISIFKELNDQKLLCKSYNNIGLVYFARIEYSKAKSYMQQGLEIANKINNNVEKSRILHNLALIEYEESNFDIALQYHYRSFQIAKGENNLMLMGYNYLSIGKCFLKLNKLDSADLKIQESISIFKKLENPNLIAMAYNQYADFLINIKSYTNALNIAKIAYEIGETIGSKYIELEASDLISKAYLGIKDYENALKYRTKFYELSDTMRNESNIKSIAYIEAKYEYDHQLKELSLKKESEIKYSKLITKIAILFAVLMIIVSAILYNFYRLKSKTNIQLMHKTEEISDLNLKLNHLNNTKDKFFSIIAHDLRSPFNVIIGFSELLTEQIREKNYENIEEYAVIIQNSSERTMDLLKNLLDWARLQTGKIEFVAVDFLLNDLVTETIALLNDAASQKSIQILNTINQEVTIHADRFMIGTIVRNLISNAIKFSNPGGTITITTERNDNKMVFSVKDNGIGISKADQLRMFRIEENFTVKGTQNEKGTGLGLILCKEFIEKYGGKIWVKSEEGVGSTFSFTLPVNNK